MSEWTETLLPESRCPFCAAKLDAASGQDGARPTPGDVSVCLYCASPLVFDTALRLRVLTPAEMRSLEPDTRAEMERYMRVARSIDRRSP